MELKIEKGIPVPDCKNGKSANRIVIEGMKVGDSVLVPDANAAQRVVLWIKKSGGEAARRKHDVKTIPQKYRVWRIK